MYYPRLGGAVNDRISGPMKGVFKTRFHSHLQGLVDAMIDRDTTDIQSSLDVGGVLSGVMLQQNPRPLDLA